VLFPPIGSLASLFLWGLVTGGIYILLGSGVNLIFGVMKLVNFAHGQFMILGGYVALSIAVLTFQNGYLAILIAIPIVAFFGIAVERGTFNRVKGKSLIGGLSKSEFFVSFALIFMLENGISLIWGDYPQRIPSPFFNTVLSLGGSTIPLDWLTAVLVSAIVSVGFYFLVIKSKIGRAMRATSQNRNEAMLMGVDTRKIDILSFGIGIGLAVIAGSLLGILLPFDPTSGTGPTMKAFAVIILGGIGNPLGAVIGGLSLGLVESFGVYFIGGQQENSIAFVFVIAVLLIRPMGILGKRSAVEK